MIHNHSEDYEQDRRWVAAGLLRLRHCLQPHHHPHDGGAGHHQRVHKVQPSNMGWKYLCWYHQALTDPTVKHECSPEPIADNLDYYVTYRWHHCHHYHNHKRIKFLDIVNAPQEQGGSPRWAVQARQAEQRTLGSQLHLPCQPGQVRSSSSSWWSVSQSSPLLTPSRPLTWGRMPVGESSSVQLTLTEVTTASFS